MNNNVSPFSKCFYKKSYQVREDRLFPGMHQLNSDLFYFRFQASHVRTYFPEYEGPDQDAEAAINFFTDEFRFFNGPNPASFSFIFSLFNQTIPFFTTN